MRPNASSTGISLVASDLSSIDLLENEPNLASVSPTVGAEKLTARYSIAPLPQNEQARLAALKRYEVLDTDDEQCYDDLTYLASMICGSPMALLTLLDEERQWFKSRVGLANHIRWTPRDVSFCSHAILTPDRVFEVPNALQDPRFAENPLVTDELNIRYYAGAPLVTPEGTAIGTICVLDQQPNKLSPTQLEGLRRLARQAVAQFELRASIAELERQSLTDGLTGVWNRRAFDRRLREEWARHARVERSLSLLMIDVDRFKAYNDSYGHPEGDRALIKTAELLGKSLRSADYLVRYGGEEFAVILPESDSEGARVAAERIRLLVEGASWPHTGVTVSIGIASAIPTREMERNVFVACADSALYRAKNRGRNRVESFDDWIGDVDEPQKSSTQIGA